MAASLCAHAALLLVSVPLATAPPEPPAVVTHVEVAVALALETPEPPPAEVVPLPERSDEEVVPRESTTEPAEAPEADWVEELEADHDEWLREALTCPDPGGPSVRFRAATRPAASEPTEGVTGGEAVAAATAAAETGTAAPAAPRRVGAGVIAHVAPTYPRVARRRGIEGAVRLRLLIGADGTLTSIELLESSGSAVLDRAATAAVEDWTFRPATLDGRAVAGTLDLPPIRFALTD